MRSICPHCKSIIWELVTESPNGSTVKINFIRCMTCKAPIGVIPFFDLYAKLELMDKEIKALKSSNSTIASVLQVIDQNIRKLFQK